jgi:hypothetical protein
MKICKSREVQCSNAGVFAADREIDTVAVLRRPLMFRDPGLPDWLEFVLGLLGYRW